MRLRTLVLLALVTQCGLAVLAQWILPRPPDLHYFSVWMDMGYRGGLTHVYSWPDREVEALYGPAYNVNYPPLIFYLYYPLYWLLRCSGALTGSPSPWLNPWPPGARS